jgi:hypothetical protein
MTSVSAPAFGGKEVATVDDSRGQGAVVYHRAAARMPVRSGVASEVFGCLVAEVFHAVTPLDQRHALGGETLQFDRADFGAILVTLAALLRLFVIVELAFDALVGAVEEIDGRPQQVLEVGFEAGNAGVKQKNPAGHGRRGLALSSAQRLELVHILTRRQASSIACHSSQGLLLSSPGHLIGSPLLP